MLAKFSTLAGGVWIEQRDEAEYSAQTRCFRFDSEGRSEFAYYGEIIANPNREPRWYGHVYTSKDFIFA